LSHQKTELPFHLIAPFPRNEAEHARIAGRWVQQTGKHLEDCGLARAVRAEKTDELALFDIKGNVVGCARFIVTALDQAFD